MADVLAKKPSACRTEGGGGAGGRRLAVGHRRLLVGQQGLLGAAG